MNHNPELVSFVKNIWSDPDANLAKVVGELRREKGFTRSEPQDIAESILGAELDHRSISKIESMYFESKVLSRGQVRLPLCCGAAVSAAFELIPYISSEDGQIRLRVSHLLRMCVNTMRTML